MEKSLVPPEKTTQGNSLGTKFISSFIPRKSLGATVVLITSAAFRASNEPDFRDNRNSGLFADLDSNDFARDDNFDSSVLLPAVGGGIIGNRRTLAKSLRCHVSLS